MRLIALLVAYGTLVWAQTVKTVEVKADGKWMDTGIALAQGDQYSIEGSGEVTYGTQKAGPQGLSRGFRDLVRVMPVNEAGRGALIGRIGDRETSQPFFIGPRKDATVALGGNLFLNVNQGAMDSGSGSYSVKVTVTKGVPVQKTSVNRTVVELTQAQLDSLPTRVVDAQGNEGDRVNFIVVGPEASVVAALKTAGWVQVDKSNKDTIINALLLTMSKQAYLTIPMSTLMMFGRGQDYGFAHAVPYVVVAQRHHFRIWKAPFQVNGTDVWVGAGTHDIGFERDQRNNGVTHKIDPETDKERDYIGQTLEESGLVIQKKFMTHKTPVKEAKTATGGSFRSDGNTLIIYLEQRKNEVAQQFANLFCSVLATNPDGGNWGECTQYVELNPTAKVDLKPMSRDYRVVVVPGIFSSCASDAPAFEKGRVNLKEKQGVEAALLSVPNNSSEDNGKAIAKYLRENFASDKRKYILVGYSKGTPDIQTALATEPDIRGMVAAFVAVAGASGGSPVADALPQRLNTLLAKVNGKGSCQGDLSDGFQSLKVENRRQFLATYPNPFVPTYSLPAVADKDKVSKVMVQGWTMMNSFSARNDAQLGEEDATVPGSTVLGAARSDHFALALPLEDMQGGALKSLLDKNSFPRAALLESLVRYVLTDLKAAPAATPYQAPAKKPSIFQ